MKKNNTVDSSKEDVFKPQYSRDAYREAQRDRIFDTIVVGCYTKQEFQMAWYNYLNENLIFPFEADILVRINHSRAITTKSITVLELADEAACHEHIYVKAKIGSEYDYFYVSILDFKCVKADKDSQQAIADWQYWNSDYF